MKVEDRQLAKSVGVFAHPSLVIFRNYGEEAVIYSGDIKVKTRFRDRYLAIIPIECRLSNQLSDFCWVDSDKQMKFWQKKKMLQNLQY